MKHKPLDYEMSKVEVKRVKVGVAVNLGARLRALMTVPWYIAAARILLVDFGGSRVEPMTGSLLPWFGRLVIPLGLMR